MQPAKENNTNMTTEMELFPYGTISGTQKVVSFVATFKIKLFTSTLKSQPNSLGHI